jgi:hypothetical protein
MSDAARLASNAFQNKPKGVSYSHFQLSVSEIFQIRAKLGDAIIESVYAAIVSYAEALSSLQKNSISWSVIRLYYSCFYSLRALLLINDIIPFNCRGEMFFCISSGKFQRGGTSSHHWNWGAIRKFSQLNAVWFVSVDSQEAYEKLRKHRENINYTHAFTDPALHSCLIAGESDLTKRFRLYRDDREFFYTYLENHLAIAYPTKLIFTVEEYLRNSSLSLPSENISHIKELWSMRDRCPGNMS